MILKELGVNDILTNIILFEFWMADKTYFDSFTSKNC